MHCIRVFHMYSTNSSRQPAWFPEGIYKGDRAGLVAYATTSTSSYEQDKYVKNSSKQVFPGTQVEFWKARSKVAFSTCYDGAMENMIILIANLIELEITEAISKAQL